MLEIIRYLRDQRGIETLEWILIGGLVTAVGIFLYGPPGVLQAGLNGALSTITSTITSSATP